MNDQECERVARDVINAKRDRLRSISAKLTEEAALAAAAKDEVELAPILARGNALLVQANIIVCEINSLVIQSGDTA